MTQDERIDERLNRFRTLLIWDISCRQIGKRYYNKIDLIQDDGKQFFLALSFHGNWEKIVNPKVFL